ncbi:MAG: ADP-ribose pyrophosphatase [Deltaproteobacteria bacterium]|nr:MAG: ADP-ribose pyrophosphatase [Deltaproteobacteria bacterium]RLB84633.1 MAG: ADP-ribose pyrophosphatase [Deltaproteobacteria bacterium]
MKLSVIQTKLIHKARVFDLVHEKVVLPNGTEMEIDIIRHPGASAIVPMKDSETLLLLKQYRHAIGESLWEVPAGTLNKGETPLDCAKRELEEETGFTADSWHKLGVITPLPAYSDERIHIYLAKDLRASRQALDPDEIIEVREVPFNKAIKMIGTGQIKDGKSISSLFLAGLYLRK